MNRFCSWPFENAWIRNGGIVDGNINEMKFEDVVNSHKAQAMRKSILDGTYDYCSPDCPKLFDKYDASKNAKYQQIIEKELLTVTKIRHIVLGYDEGCPLACPSCRKAIFFPKGEWLALLKKYHETVLEKIPAPEAMNVSGSGDAIGSVTTRTFLRNFSSYPKFSNTKLMLSTNGVLLTKKAWLSIQESHSNIELISVSIDGTTEETYRKTRTGELQQVKENMSFLCSQKRHYTYRLHVNFIVQKNNYREMCEMVDLCHDWQVDRLNFVPIRFWASGAYTKEEMTEQQVFNNTHRLFENFCECLKDQRLNDSIVDLQGILKTLKKQCT